MEAGEKRVPEVAGSARQAEPLAGGLDTDIKPDTWFQRLAKYVPSEGIGLYLALAGLVTEAESAMPRGVILLALILSVCILFNSLFLRHLWKVRRWSQIIVSDIALLAYAFATGGALIQKLPFYEPRWGTVVLIVTTTFLVFFNPPSDERNTPDTEVEAQPAARG
jgi:hypothetical protein